MVAFSKSVENKGFYLRLVEMEFAQAFSDFEHFEKHLTLRGSSSQTTYPTWSEMACEK